MKIPVLIPRDETSYLVEYVNKIIKDKKKFLEIGCGTGAISLSLLKLQLIHVDFENYVTSCNQKFDFIVSNPPYIPSRKIKDLDFSVIKYEDIVALDGGIQGLDLIEKIIQQGINILNQNGFIALETDQGQKELIQQMFVQNNWGQIYKEPVFYKDQYDVERFCFIHKK
ncbi:modification family, putative [Ichthyophthirius multifiliis]|uniref:Modification family, putative n=1 Tax=Ichthyophthirius multifiliis TaxID=5932 RepID=G0QT72_ICHMU|nr:modification family, putative [Ichthyophthirius multifiliis]EGR31597.1 modification family, putative [Ichthyophthirius multifiliis]|eukprot:XP_004035083.1 modification family, putative [Ichthyophthirius multifiliis]